MNGKTSVSHQPNAFVMPPDLILERCQCGHHWHEHHTGMGGCQHFNISKHPPYCQCDGYRRKEKEK
jgi:hypothetical protein